jgi:hypothetical protein
MIFQKDDINKIINGEKTQTRRVNRGRYQLNRPYAIQLGRGKPALNGYKIVFDTIEVEKPPTLISWDDAQAEGGYLPDEYEKLFQRLYPTWNCLSDDRWVFKFHVIRVDNK